MHITVLQAGSPPDALIDTFGSYGAMVRGLLGPDFCVSIKDVRSGDAPGLDSPTCGYVITGSSSGVYDTDGWIAALETFVKTIAGRKPMIGICFGHQLMAQAFGGTVVKSPKGWGVGLHDYEIRGAAPWLGPADGFSLPASHQDQVVEIGPDAKVLAGSAFTPFAMLNYPSLRAMSLQPHPEFTPQFAKALLALRRGDRFDATTADTAIASLDRPHSRANVQGWLKQFLQTA